jgi:polygalacturonase
VTVNTKAIQKAIDDCHESGGGKVLFSNGNYVTGTLFLKSNVILHIEVGATLSGSIKISDYASNVFHNMPRDKNKKEGCLIYAENAENIGIEGKGKIDGRGFRSNFPNPDDPIQDRPMLIRFLKCENVSLQDIVLQNPASWTVAMIYCKRINVQGVTVSSKVNANGDGLDFDGCENVTISNCVLDTSDDSICLYAHSKDYPCRYFTISNCIMTSSRSGIRINNLGDFNNITVDNCVFHDINDAAIKIQNREGGRMENFAFSNMIMKEVICAVFLSFNEYTDNSTEPVPVRTMKNLIFNNIRVESKTMQKDNLKSLILISGLPGQYIENVTFRNFSITAQGGGTLSDGEIRTVPELRYIRYGSGTQQTVPAYGVYTRHVKGLYLDNMILNTAMPDSRPAAICDDVINMEFSDSKAAVTSDAECVIRLQNVQQAWIRNCQPLGDNETFLQVEGEDSREILLSGNDLRRIENSFSCVNGAAKGAVTTINNIN